MPQGAAFGNSKDRASTSIGGGGGGGGKSSGSSGPGAYNGQGRPNAPTVAQQAAAPTGARGPIGQGGLLNHTTSVLGVGSPFQGAVADYGANYLGDKLSRVAKNLTGIGLQAPDPNRPSTYANGLSHTGLDPLGVALGIAGTATGMPVGALYNAGKMLTGWDGPMVTIGGGQPGVPGPGQGFNYSGTGPQGRYGQGVNTGQAPQGLGRQNSAGDHLQQLAALNSQIPGNPGAPTSSGTATPPGLPGPNYSQMLGRLQQITPGYGVQLPGYQYSGRATN